MKKWLLAALKVGVSGALIAYLVRRTDLAEVWTVVRGADGLILGSAFFLFYVGYSIVAKRWQLLLSALGTAVSFWYLFRSFMVGVFFNNFLPSIVGGDAMRMYDSWRSGITKTKSVAAVVMDRFMGLAALLLFALWGLALGAHESFTQSGIVLVVGACAGGALALLFILIFMADVVSTVVDRLARVMPEKIAQIVSLIVSALRSFAARRDVLFSAMLLSIVLQTNVIVYHWLVAVAFGFDVDLTAFFLIVPVAIVAMALPISINGIGVRESIFVLLLGTQGVTQAEGLAYAWLVYSFLLIQGLIGGVVFAFRSETREEPPADSRLW